MKKMGFAAALAAGLAVISGLAYADEVTITGASCFPIGSESSASFERLVADINERGKGLLQVNLVGGAPAIGNPFTITQKMSKGVYDIIGCVDGYFEDVLPEAGVLRLSEVPFATLRENGGFEMISDLLAKKGIHYVGRHFDSGPYHLWTSQKLEKPDLSRLNLRVAPQYTAFFKTLGATVQTAGIGEIFTYLENNTIQGYGWPVLGWVPTWITVTKYRVEPGFYNGSIHTLTNKAKWDSLTKEQQDLITQIVIEHEVASEPANPEHLARIQAAKDKLAAEGMQEIRFTGEAAEFWVSTANKAAWDEIVARSPEAGAKLKALFTK